MPSPPWPQSSIGFHPRVPCPVPLSVPVYHCPRGWEDDRSSASALLPREQTGGHIVYMGVRARERPWISLLIPPDEDPCYLMAPTSSLMAAHRPKIGHICETPVNATRWVG